MSVAPWTSNYLYPEDHVRWHFKASCTHIWGYVIIRCTYRSDLQWGEFIRRMNVWAHEGLEESPDIESSLVWNVIEDCDRLNGKVVGEMGPIYRHWHDT